ncbi:hypothetical protein PMAYCL1PPCAC_33418, partial [Pristionchus mayeri]
QQQQQQQQQQLTRQNLDRLATSSAAAAPGSSGSRTSDWLGGLPPPSSNGAGGPPPLQSMPQLQQPAAQPPTGVAEVEEEEQEAAPHLAAENEPNLNVESLNAEEAFQQEGNGGGHGKKKHAGKQSKVLIHEIDGHKIIETTEPSNSAHLDVHDFEPMHDDDDDQSDKSYEGKDEDVGQRKFVNGLAPVLVHQAAEWMQNRLEMDIPRDERKPKDTPQSHKPSTRADGKKKSRGKQKTNELKSLLQMDFGPAENSRRAQEMLPVVIKTAETAILKESPKEKNLRKERRSTSAMGGAVPPATTNNGKETRSLRTRDSTDKVKECRTCGVPLEEKRSGKQHPDIAARSATRISCSPTNSEDEDDEMTSVRTDETPEPTKKKESSATPTSASKRRIKEEPMDEKETPSLPPRRRGRWNAKKEMEEKEMMITPKKEVITPKKESAEKKKVERKIKEERMDEETEDEKQKSPAAKRRSVVDKKEEPASKTRKVDPPVPPAAPAAGQTPLLAAALSAPSVYPQPQPAAAPTPLLVQQLLQPRLPAAVAEVAPSPAFATAPAAAAAAVPAPAAATALAMDPVTCRQLSVEQVRAWVEQITENLRVAQLFANEDVDGETLLTLKYDDLRGDLKLSLGMARRCTQQLKK